ncbi:hypothetical protein HN51_028089 [Arachis hypogaea]
MQIYGSEYIEAYKQRCNDNPHVYAVADATYNDMIRDEVNQSIIIRSALNTFLFIYVAELYGIELLKK